MYLRQSSEEEICKISTRKIRQLSFVYEKHYGRKDIVPQKCKNFTRKARHSDYKI